MITTCSYEEVSYMAIRVHLEEVLKARGMTSKELCAKIGITEANLSILRSGKAKGVRFSTINKICYYLDCDVGDILKFDGNLEDEDDE
jgi:putative transcriptional regulator